MTDGDGGSGEDYQPEQRLSSPADDDFDALTLVAAQITLNERLLVDLQAIVPTDDLPIAEFLIGSLGDDGFLACSVEEVADVCRVDLDRVMVVLTALQSLDPVGIGARDLRECLLIQVDHLASQGIVCPGVREIIRDHFIDLGERKLARIGRHMGMPAEAVATACAFIKARLNPFPSHSYLGPDNRVTDGRSAYVWPDVIVREEAGTFTIEVVESQRSFLHVGPFYQKLMADIGRDAQTFSASDRQHVKQYVSRAKLFMANIQQRRQTLQKVAQCIVDHQKEYLRHGIRFIQPLTRAEMATILGLHESTISRATASKYIMLPNRKVVALGTFFTASLSVMDVMREIVANEMSPMADMQIAEELSRRGIHIARRTVTKYRDKLAILPSSLR